MAMLTNAFNVFGATGNREDLTDILEVISPKEAPLYDAMGTAPCKGVYHEWQTDALAAANPENAAVEGETFGADAVTPTGRLGNYCQICTKEFTITETQEVVAKAARSSEVSYQKAKALAELKRDFEAILFNYNGSASGNAGKTTVPRRMRNVHSWVIGVTGSTGYSGVPSTWISAVMTGAASIAEGTFNLILQDIWDEGGRPNAVYVNGHLKRLISGWGTSTSRVHDGSKKISNVVDVYEGDFSTVELKKDRYAASSIGYILDESLWKKSILIPAGEIPLARRGLGYDKMIRQQWTIEARNPSGNGLFISG